MNNKDLAVVLFSTALALVAGFAFSFFENRIPGIALGVVASAWMATLLFGENLRTIVVGSAVVVAGTGGAFMAGGLLGVLLPMI